jgi:N-acetyl-gamma-glutamyl-phosphate reductase
MSSTINAGIIGGAGYTGGELLRILINHPLVNIKFVNSKSNAGNQISDVHTDLLGDTDVKFSSDLSDDIDVLFLCVGHGDTKKFFDENPKYLSQNKIKLIDLSQDFRPESESFVYGLPELKRDTIKKSSRIANPGCFATCIQLSLLPLAKAQLLNNEIHISATTGSTGAGQALSSTSHFTWRNNNLSVYKAFEHQHLKEINQSLKQLQGSFGQTINFIPYRGDFTRGIIASVYTKFAGTIEEATKIYTEYYALHPFTHVSTKNIDLKQIVNTNKCLLYLEKHGDNLMIISIIDNLTKGASGQAVQNMNLMFGFEENSGLKLKPVGF